MIHSADARLDTPFVAATKRNYPLARERMEAAYPDAPAHLMSDLVRNAAALLASDEVSGRAKGAVRSAYGMGVRA